MNIRDWKYQIKKTCIEAGVYEPSCDRVIDELADLMYMLQDWKAEYEKAKLDDDFEKKRECTIRKADLHKTSRQFWADLLLTTKAYRDFMNKGAETTIKKDDVLEALEKFENE